jgi:hypothetical protein
MWKINYPSVHGKEYSDKAKALMNKTLDKKIEPFDLISEMLEMDKEYPDLGWVENAYIVHLNLAKRLKMAIPERSDYAKFKQKPLLVELFCINPCHDMP